MRANFRSISDGILFQSIKLKEETEVQDHSFHWDGIQMDGWMDCGEEEAPLGYDGSDGCCGVDIRDSRGSSSSISTASPASPTMPWRKTCLRTSRFDCRHTPWGTDERWN